MSATVKSLQNFQSVPFNRLKADFAENIRQEYKDIDLLGESILQNGQTDPITAYKEGSDYIVVHGFRRYSAVKMLVENGKVAEDFPIIVNKIDKPERGQHIIINLIGNNGVAFNSVELATAFKELTDLGYNQKQIAEMSGRTQPDVSNHLQLLNMDKDVIDAVSSGAIAFNTAIAAHRAKKTDELIQSINAPQSENEGETKPQKKATIKQFTAADKKGETVNGLKLIASVLKQLDKGEFPAHDKRVKEILQDLVDGIADENDILELLGV
jgi:ParB/RepB/Spo0J family partition protein